MWQSNVIKRENRFTLARDREGGHTAWLLMIIALCFGFSLFKIRFLKYLFPLYVWILLLRRMCMLFVRDWYPQRSDEGVRISGTGVRDGCELPSGSRTRTWVIYRCSKLLSCLSSCFWKQIWWQDAMTNTGGQLDWIWNQLRGRLLGQVFRRALNERTN